MVDDIKIVHELFHFMKATYESSKGIDGYIKEIVENADKWCPFTHEEGIDNSCYCLNDRVKYLNFFLDRFIKSYEMVGIDPYHLAKLKEYSEKLRNPETLHSFDDFKGYIDNIIFIIERDKPKISSYFSQLTCEECIRMDEALTCYMNHSYLASTVLTVSAVEARLHNIFSKKSSKFYKQNFEKATLGQLIQVFDDNKYLDKHYLKYKKILPPEYKPLLEILNTYRVFSAHPKGKRIEAHIAESILKLALSFLVDERLAVEEKLTICGAQKENNIEQEENLNYV